MDKVLRDALLTVRETLKHSRKTPMEDPRPDRVEAVTRLGEQIGFGAMMAIAERVWRERVEKQGLAGSEFVQGPTRFMFDRMMEQVDAALAASENEA